MRMHHNCEVTVNKGEMSKQEKCPNNKVSRDVYYVGWYSMQEVFNVICRFPNVQLSSIVTHSVFIMTLGTYRYVL